jgi:hypothetical protein
VNYDMPGELHPAPAPSRRGRFRFDESQDAVVEVPPTEAELADRARRIELERRELLDAQWRRR